MKGRFVRGEFLTAMLAPGIAAGVLTSSAAAESTGYGHSFLAILVIATALLCAAAQFSHGSSCRVLIPAAVFAAGLCRGLQWGLTGGGDWIERSQLINSAFDALRGSIGKLGLSDNARALVTALISGDRSDIPGDIREAFRISGASHILALSGLHLGIIYGLISGLFSLAGRKPAIVKIRSAATTLLCGIYAVVTGAGPSITRAFLFILLRESARATGRSSAPLTIFTSGIAIHLTISPGSVLMPGFQLSYLAMCGIYLLHPRIDALYPKSKGDPLGKIWTMASMSISCQLFTAPVAWLYFGSFPQWFLLTNMIAMPLSSVLMLSAVTALVLSALGICPAFLTSITDSLARALIWSLQVISS